MWLQGGSDAERLGLEEGKVVEEEPGETREEKEKLQCLFQFWLSRLESRSTLVGLHKTEASHPSVRLPLIPCHLRVRV